ncbi:MAG: ABC transporter permease [Culturomica sp.]|jgi:putative ABC transport system permease protein|nr:ABC transporter permease [Culturomica sp.]
MIFKNLWNTLRRYKESSILNILGLSVAFAAFTIILMQVSYEYSYGRTDTNYRRIFRVETLSPFDQRYGANILYYQERAERVFQSIADIEARAELLYFAREVTIDREGEKIVFDEIPALGIFNDISQVFDIRMVQGEFTSALEPGKMLISQSYARKLFGKEDPVGKTLGFGGGSYTVSGVYRDFPRNATLQGELIYLRQTRGGAAVKTVFLLLNDPARAAEVAALLQQNLEPAPDESTYRLNPAEEIYFSSDVGENTFIRRGNRYTTDFLSVVAGLILLISAINFVNFSTALMPVRLRALNTRRVLGESRASLRRAMIFEAMGLTMIAFGFSLLLVDAVGKTALGDLLAIGDISIGGNLELIGRVSGIALATGFAAGLYPAFYATSFPPALALKGTFSATPQGKRLRTVLVGVQYTISIALIVFALFIHCQNRYFQQVPVGYNKEDVLRLNTQQYGLRTSIDVIRQELERLPGVLGTAFSSSFGTWNYDLSMNFPLGNDTVDIKGYMVDLDFMELMQIPIVEGRGFREGDPVFRYESGENRFILPVVINRKMADRYGLKVDTVLSSSIQVIGISGDVIARSMHRLTEDIAFWPTDFRQLYEMFIRVAPHDRTATIESIRRVLDRHATDNRRSMAFHTEILDELYTKERNLGTLISLFSGLAVLISIIGVFGLVLFETQYRRKEIGLRKVHGATIGEILRRLNRNFIRIVLVCFVIAAPIAWYAVQQWSEGFAYRSPVHWWIFAAALLAVGAVTVLTVTLQSYRAATENPVNSIKTE